MKYWDRVLGVEKYQIPEVVTIVESFLNQLKAIGCNVYQT